MDWERQAFGVVDSAEDDQVERHDHAGADLVIGADIVSSRSQSSQGEVLHWLCTVSDLRRCAVVLLETLLIRPLSRSLMMRQVYDPSLTAPLAATIAWLLRPRTSCRSQGVARAEFASDPRRDERQAIIAGTIRNETTWELFLSECREFVLRHALFLIARD